MQVALQREDEVAALVALARLDVFDSDADVGLTALAQAAAAICDTPMAGISLVDAHQQWFKATVGLPVVRPAPRGTAFCAYGVLGDALFEVRDAAADARFTDNPLVSSPPGIRFYAGAPLRTIDDQIVGMLCVLDHQPRQLDATQRARLMDLGEAASQALEGRRANRATQAARLQATGAAPPRQAAADGAGRGVHRGGTPHLLETLPGMAISVQPDGKMVAVSNRWLEKMGYSRDEVIGRRSREFLTAASAERSVHTALPSLFATGRADEIPFEMVARNGDVIDTLMSAVVEPARNGLPQRTTTLITDVTPLRRAERALRDEQQRLARIIEGTRAGTWEVDLSTGENRINEVYAAMLGHAPGELPIRTVQEFIERVHPDDRPMLAAEWEPSVGSGSDAHDREFRMRHRDGHWVWVLSRGSVVSRDAQGRALKVAGTHLDISDRKAEQLAAAALRRDLRIVIDALPSMIGSWDRHLINRFANAAYGEWFGVDHLALPGSHISKLLGDALFRHNLPFMEAVLRGEQQVFEHPIPRPDGSGVRHALVRYVPNRADGEVQGFYVLVSDVTPLKEAQAKLEASNAELQQRTREAEAANAVKDEFLMAMSHELRTPLTSIRGYAELLAQLLEPPQFREMAGRIASSSIHLNGLLTDILDLSKVEAGVMTLNCEDHDLRALVQGTADFFSLTAANKGLALSVHLSPDLPPTLSCDSLRVRQILTNLLSNALKFTPSGGVCISVERIAEGIAFHVDDTGPGIPPALHEVIFEKFRQASAQVSNDHGGTGLGLTLARGLAERMQGRLTLDRSGAGGSRFTLSLPIVAARD